MWLEFSDAFVTGDYAPSPSQNPRSLKKKNAYLTIQAKTISGGMFLN